MDDGFYFVVFCNLIPLPLYIPLSFVLAVIRCLNYQKRLKKNWNTIAQTRVSLFKTCCCPHWPTLQKAVAAVAMKPVIRKTRS